MPGDFDAGPTTQIRDRQYFIDSPSLNAPGNEPVPDEVFRDLLKLEWMETELTPRPSITVADEQSQLAINVGAITVEVEAYDETFNGHRHEFVDQEIRLAIVVMTSVSRQRAWNYMAEIRRITYRWILALMPWQSLYFEGWTPEYVGPNHYEGTVRVRLTAAALPAFTRHITGAQTPATNPAAFGRGPA